MATPETRLPETVRWGIVGCGDVTEVKSGPAYQDTEGFELAAVMRRTAGKAKDYAQRHGVPKYGTDADELIQDNKIDAVYIATPPDSHRHYALKVAAAGKPCCIEKPMSPCYADSLAICEAFQEKGLPLFVAYYRRSLPRFEQVKTWLDEGRIGEVRNVTWQFHRPPSKSDLAKAENWRTDARVAPGGYFDDVASHGLDLIVYLLGDVREATGFSTNQQELYTGKDAITGSWLHESGATGSGSWNFAAGNGKELVEVLGSTGKIEFSVFREAPLELTDGDGHQELLIEHPKHIQIHHVRKMRDCLRGEAEHPSTGLTATHTSWLMDKILGHL
ncbi:MAG: Gfo/Idh/MocA family oxidoreductase [Victivallales bacterium]|jgi:1,5-anhydro-D-fructose reductase (1,5-anhydro-D-mannitol-forming)|nr:Gfo/Idh/MocA family oxidoreductase [Victivallales bacterium]MBT7298266.1 Gfo/Idh/MocA family oxidoreductase [Victivallales bacterium]